MHCCETPRQSNYKSRQQETCTRVFFIHLYNVNKLSQEHWRIQQAYHGEQQGMCSISVPHQ